MKVLTLSGITKVFRIVKSAILGKYDKSGGDISGSVKIFGNLIFDIDDEDYDSGVEITKQLDTNAGTILILRGYANSDSENTNYRVVFRNVADPILDYDAASKHYVDSRINQQVVHKSYYLVDLNDDGSIRNKTVTLLYDRVKSELTSYNAEPILDVLYGDSRFHVPAVQDQDTNAGPIVFIGPLRMSDGSITESVFLLDSDDSLSVYYTKRENALLKTSDLAANSLSELYYPTVKGVWDTFQRKPVVIWETDSDGIIALGADLTETIAWQLTNLDMTPYKRVKIYTKANKKPSGVGVDASNTPAVVLEMSLDPRAASPVGGHYVGSHVGQKPNDANRLYTVTCAISADKTSFAVLRMSTLYGTAATSNSDVNGYVFKIEGYYD